MKSCLECIYCYINVRRAVCCHKMWLPIEQNMVVSLVAVAHTAEVCSSYTRYVHKIYYVRQFVEAELHRIP